MTEEDGCRMTPMITGVLDSLKKLYVLKESVMLKDATMLKPTM